MAVVRYHDRRGVTRTAAQRDDWTRMLESGEASTRADLARRVAVSRARVSQVLGPRSGGGEA